MDHFSEAFKRLFDGLGSILSSIEPFLKGCEELVGKFFKSLENLTPSLPKEYVRQFGWTAILIEIGGFIAMVWALSYADEAKLALRTPTAQTVGTVWRWSIAFTLQTLGIVLARKCDTALGSPRHYGRSRRYDAYAFAWTIGLMMWIPFTALSILGAIFYFFPNN